MHVSQVAVAENLNAGSIYQIFLFDDNRKQYKVYQDDEIIQPLAPEGRMFRHMMARTEYLVIELKLVLHTDAIPGMQQIDAIGISDVQEPIRATIHTYDDPGFIPVPESLGPLVNSTYDDMLPIISPDGRELYFGRKFSPENVGEMHLDDIYASERLADGSWSRSVNIGSPLNNQYPNYVCAVSPDNNQLVLANEYNATGGLTQGVSIAQRQPDGAWSKPRDLRIKSFYNLNKFSCYHMNPDMDIVVMAIERHDTYGDMDLYVSFQEDGWNWTEPKHLGPDVNTAGTEGSVFIAADNRTIYFCSDGFSGYGSLDMFMSRRLDETWTNWTEPVNLGPHINSRQRDFYYTIPASGEYAYYSSDQNSMGRSDLFRIRLPDAVKPLPVAFLKAKTIDALTGEPIHVPLTYTIPDIDYRKTVTGEEDGDVVMILPREPGLIELDKPGYFPVRRDLTLEQSIPEDDLQDYEETDIEEELLREVKEEVRDSIQADIEEQLKSETDEVIARQLREQARQDSIQAVQAEAQRKKQELIDEVVRAELAERERKREEAKEELRKQAEAEVKREEAERMKAATEYTEITDDIAMTPLREGQVVRLDNIWFDANKWTLRPESTAELERLAQFLKDNPNIYAEIGGHTNGLPSDAFCDTLSDNRAKAVVEYLIASGVPASRLSWKGYGKRKPVATNATLAGRKQNQRVELKIVRVE
jgi:outer membrane protein OmpA-like peptidoglycan-associated protein